MYSYLENDSKATRGAVATAPFVMEQIGKFSCFSYRFYFS
jgi:hypothetical protein